MKLNVKGAQLASCRFGKNYYIFTNYLFFILLTIDVLSFKYEYITSILFFLLVAAHINLKKVLDSKRYILFLIPAILLPLVPWGTNLLISNYDPTPDIFINYLRFVQFFLFGILFEFLNKESNGSFFSDPTPFILFPITIAIIDTISTDPMLGMDSHFRNHNKAGFLFFCLAIYSFNKFTNIDKDKTFALKYLLLLMISLYFALISFSRMAWIGIAIFFILKIIDDLLPLLSFLKVSFRRIKKVSLYTVICLLLLGSIISAIYLLDLDFETISLRFQSIFYLITGVSDQWGGHAIEERLRTLNLAIDLFKTTGNPFGVGIGQLGLYNDNYISKIVLELGILCIFIFYSYYIFFRNCNKNQKYFLFSNLIMAFTLDTLQSFLPLVYFWYTYMYLNSQHKTVTFHKAQS